MTICIVAGFGRCGTSLVMNMLHAGGISVMGQAPAFEPKQLGILDFSVPWIEARSGHAMKYIDPTCERLPRRQFGRVLWLDRNAGQQAKSQAKMLRMFNGIHTGRQGRRKLAKSLRDDRPNALKIVSDFGPVTVLSFEGILANPTGAANILAEFATEIGKLNVDAAADQVIPRSAICAAGMEIEAALIEGAAERYQENA